MGGKKASEQDQVLRQVTIGGWGGNTTVKRNNIDSYSLSKVPVSFDAWTIVSYRDDKISQKIASKGACLPTTRLEGGGHLPP